MEKVICPKGDHHGHVDIEQANLYSRPETAPPLIGAALSKETAAWLAEWADSMITIATPDKPIYLKAQYSYDETDEAALEGAYEQWRNRCVPGTVTQELRTPVDYDELGEQIDEEDVEANVRISADLEDHLEFLVAVRPRLLLAHRMPCFAAE